MERDPVETPDPILSWRASARLPSRLSLLLVGVTLGLLAAACGGGGGFDDPRLREFDDQFTTSGQPHLPPGTPAGYNSTPPYAGPHWSQALRCGIYEQEQLFEPMVHTMEHGAVILYYQPLVHETDDIAAMRVVASALIGDGARLIMTPSSRLSQPVVLASWGRLLAMDAFEEATLRAFIDVFEGDAPEDVRC